MFLSLSLTRLCREIWQPEKSVSKGRGNTKVEKTTERRALLNLLLTKYYSGDRTKNNVLDRRVAGMGIS